VPTGGVNATSFPNLTRRERSCSDPSSRDANFRSVNKVARRETEARRPGDQWMAVAA
jgi:hypothetical protein